MNRKIKFFEVEVLSVSAGNTFDIIEKYKIHACPVSYTYKAPLFITFRNKGGGEMKRLYKIDDIIEFSPKNLHQIEDIKADNPTYLTRLMGYLADRAKIFGYAKEEDYRFYILSESDQIELEHTPKPDKVNSPGARYYSLAEILSGKQTIKSISAK